MTDEQRKKAIQIYDLLCSQRFSNWFGFCYAGDIATNGDFELHILGEENAPTKEEILQQIVEMFSL
jgi:hypothetical protein